MMRILKLICVSFLWVLSSNGQDVYRFKVLTWNLLNFPNSTNTTADTTARFPSYRTVIEYANPDIVVTQENNTSFSSNWFVTQILNKTANPGFVEGIYINSFDTDNLIFFKDSLFRFVANIPISTSLRDINQFVLIYRPTGDTIRIFSCHLKAGLGYEVQRGTEIQALRQVTNALPAGSNFMVVGDFNIYTSAEPAYVYLKQDNPNDDGNFIDPLNLVGTWNNSPYARYHTQSTRLVNVGGGSTGGMNDRFDMILYSNGIAAPTGLYYVPGSYINIGNDGRHYNQAINNGSNTAVPMSVANALYAASDHLPIMVTIEAGLTSNVTADFTNGGLTVYPHPAVPGSIVEVELVKSAPLNLSLFDLSGKSVLRMSYDGQVGINRLTPDWSSITPGFYLMSIEVDNKLINKKVIVSY